ncbi:MAG: glycosyltransferase family 4 protein [bacterium]
MEAPGKGEIGDEQMRVLRIAHASLTPALRQRERALVRCHPDVDLEVVTTPQWREAEVDVKATPDDLFRVTTARPLFSKHIQLFAYAPGPIVAALRRHRPHLIDLGHEPYSVACAEVLTLCDWFAPQAPIVMHVNHNIFHRYPPPFNWLEQRAFKRVAAAYVCSVTVSEVLRAKGFDKPTPLITYGVNLKDFSPAAKVRNGVARKPTIGFVGRMLPGKGLQILGEALAKLKMDDWQVLVVGEGSEREAFERQLGEHGLLDRAQFTGAVSYNLVSGYFDQMDVLVIPTQTTKRIREQFGRVIVEAMASGVPVIGSTCGAIPEVIGDAGLVFTEGDADALADALRRTLSDRGLREYMTRAGLARVQQYSWDRVADKMYELYRQVLKTKREGVLDSGMELAA